MQSLVATLLLLGFAIAATPDRQYHPRGRSQEPMTRNDAINPGEYEASYWINQAQEALASRLNNVMKTGTAKNVIMFLGDGLSVPTLAPARTLLGQRQGRPGEESQLFFETFPITGLSKTYCVSSQIADSACTSTAYLCGVKANQGTLGLTAAVPRYDCQASTNTSTHVDSIAAWALADGRDAGIVTNTRVTHASPSGAFAHVANRHWETDFDILQDGGDPSVCPDITDQLVNSFPGNQFKVILGGGRQEFLPTTTIDVDGIAGRRTDGRNMINEWLQNKNASGVSHTYAYTKEQMFAAAERGDHILGLFGSNHLEYTMLADTDTTEPTVADMTEAAIRILRNNERGFFLFVEGGRIDHAHHDNWAGLALDETIALDNAVQRAASLVSEDDTLIVLTADHSHSLAFNGYTARGGDILGTSGDWGDDGIPYMTLSYTNGPGFRAHQATGVRSDFRQEADYRTPTWRYHTDVPLGSETHAGDDVAVFARGPQQHVFTGLYEQNQIPHLMAYAACIGPGLHACESTETVENEIGTGDSNSSNSKVLAPGVMFIAIYSLLRNLAVL